MPEDHVPEDPCRIAVITPYCGEPLATLERCHRSVIAQSAPCVHFLVADGPARPEVVGWSGRHIALGVPHGDNGNTPRGVGALCAMNEGFGGILFLDADNWYGPDHVASVLATRAATGAEVVFTGRHLVFPDGEVIAAADPEDEARRHVDTSCMAIFPGAHRALPSWLQMPGPLSPWCDRILFALLRREFPCAWTGERTVYFETWYRGHFLLAGRAVPPDAKHPRPLAAAEVERVNEAYGRRSYRPLRIGRRGPGERS